MTRIKTIAVTGTNGKTSTVEMARQLLVKTGYLPASLGTLGLKLKNQEYLQSILIGCDAIPNLVSDLLQFYKIDTFIYEAFSSSIVGKIYDKLPLDIAVLTQIGEDHIEYHGSIEDYGIAKLRLFNEVLNENGLAIYNVKDSRSQEIKQICIDRTIRTFCYGVDHECDLSMSKVVTDNFITTGILNYQNKSYEIKLPFSGNIFVLNWLAALSITLQYEIDIKSLVNYSKQLLLPPGRFEHVGNFNNARIYIDYAHNALALKAVLMDLRNITKAKIHLIFGCGGGRDLEKRTQMGLVAFKYADYTYITNDNPRDEDPEKIRAQIKDSCPSAFEIADRKVAIENAINKVEIGDSLLIAGRGHEDFQETKGVELYLSDKQIVMNILDLNALKIKNQEENFISKHY